MEEYFPSTWHMKNLDQKIRKIINIKGIEILEKIKRDGNQ